MTDNGPFFEMVAELKRDPAHIEEIRARLPEIERLGAPCGPKAVIGLLAPLVTLYGVGDRSAAEWKAFWGFYTEALGRFPYEAVKAGINDYVQAADSEFFPKPGPLAALCGKRGLAAMTALARAQRALK